jgi:hypothetical protein
MIRLLTIFTFFILGSETRPLLQHIEYPDWDNSVRFLFIASQEPVRPGDDVELAVLADIAPGYHLYGPKEKRPSRTELEYLESEAIEWGIPVFPPVIKRDLAGLGEYDLYEGEIAIILPAKIDGLATPRRNISARIRLKYQVCTETACSPPSSTEMGIQIPVVKPGQPVQKLYLDVFERYRRAGARS